jgi:hypothetical protein
VTWPSQPLSPSLSPSTYYRPRCSSWPLSSSSRAGPWIS